MSAPMTQTPTPPPPQPQPPTPPAPTAFQRMKARLLLYFMRTRAYRFLLKYVLPSINVLIAPGPSYALRKSLRQFLQPGDIILTKHKFALTNILIGGEYSHAAICVDMYLTPQPEFPELGSTFSRRDYGLGIAEMTNRDFDVTPLEDLAHFTKGCTRILVLRGRDLSGDYAWSLSVNAMAFEHAQYDFKFYTPEIIESRMRELRRDGRGFPTSVIEELYCSELIYRSDVEGRFKIRPSMLPHLGTPYISPMDIAKAEGLRAVWEWVDPS